MTTPVVLTSDARQARGPVRDTGESSTNVGQDGVDVIFHPNQQASISHSRSKRQYFQKYNKNFTPLKSTMAAFFLMC